MKSYISDRELEYFTVMDPPDTYAYAALRIKRFIARVLPENTRMIEVFEDSGFSIAKRIPNLR
ncbi:MAG: hypothetical protein ACM34I_10510 [bacterium]